MIDSQAGNEDDDDHNHNATLIKTKQTILSDFQHYRIEIALTDLGKRKK